MVIAQCYECTSIGFDDEPGGNCSDTHPGGKVMVMMRMVIMMMKQPKTGEVPSRQWREQNRQGEKN